VTSVERYLYPSGSEIWLDSNGLLVSSSGSLWHKKLIALDDAASLFGGIPGRAMFTKFTELGWLSRQFAYG